MMKKRILNGLLIFFSAILLSACSNGRTEQIDEVYNTPEDKTVIVEEEQETDSMTELIQNTFEIDYKWYEGRFYRNLENNHLWLNLCDTDNGICVIVPGYSFNVNQPEILESDDYGTVLRYTFCEEYGRFDFIIDYMAEHDELIVLYTNYTYQTSNSVDYSGVYVYDKDLSTNMEERIVEETTTSNLGLADGQKFECFETTSGEDIILTIHLFSDENGNTTAYKGELSNGIEFWFEYASAENDVIIYNADYAGETAELIYYTNSSELYLMTSGNALNNYGGIYVGLPDMIEE